MKSRIQLVVFDMDGVLVDIDSSWHFIHKSFGADNSDNMKRYLGGEISYQEFMREDIRLWGPVHVSRIASILGNVPLMPGARNAVQSLRLRGYKTAILSAGISILANRVKMELGIDYALANGLVVDEKGLLKGEGVEIVNLLDKFSALNKLLSLANEQPQRCAVVGDSVYDIPLFKHVALSVSFNSKDDSVNAAADVVVAEKDLTRILPHL